MASEQEMNELISAWNSVIRKHNASAALLSEPQKAALKDLCALLNTKVIHVDSVPYVCAPKLGGSIDRKTSAAPIDDVDLLLLLRPESGPLDKNVVISTSREPLSAAAATLLKNVEAVVRSQPQWKVEVHRRSLQISRPSDSKLKITFDIVPAVLCKDNNSQYWLPNNDSDDPQNRWITFEPLTMSRACENAGQKHKNSRHLFSAIRAVKLWNRCQNVTFIDKAGKAQVDSPFKSYHLEVLLYGLPPNATADKPDLEILWASFSWVYARTESQTSNLRAPGQNTFVDGYMLPDRWRAARVAIKHAVDTLDAIITKRERNPKQALAAMFGDYLDEYLKD